MKVVRHVGVVFVVAVIAGWAASSSACDKDKSSASAASANGSCASGMKVSAAVASASGKEACCAGKAAVSASAHASCATKNASAGQCAAHGMGVMAATSTHGDCEACMDASNCSLALEAAGAHRQAVCLRNGVMYVFTADTQRNVSAVQAAVSRRDERMARIALAGENAHLCPECKGLRGAMASGKLSREVINIEGGALTLITSTDAATVAKLHAMAEPKLAVRIKS